MGCWAYFFYLKDAVLDFAKSLFPPVKPKILTFYANISRRCKSHAAPFYLLAKNTSTNLGGATKSLTPFKVNFAPV
jgi:hypothetical protein